MVQALGLGFGGLGCCLEPSKMVFNGFMDFNMTPYTNVATLFSTSGSRHLRFLVGFRLGIAVDRISYWLQRE